MKYLCRQKMVIDKGQMKRLILMSRMLTVSDIAISEMLAFPCLSMFPVLWAVVDFIWL